MKGYATAISLLAGMAATAFAGQDLNNLPETVLDESSSDWVVEPFAGNWSAGQQAFFSGPARQVGGLGTPYNVIEAPDGTVYFNCKAGVAKISPDGILRLVLNAAGKIEGPADEASAGHVVWNSKDNSLYVTGPNCIRRLYSKRDGTRWVEVIAGIPHKPGRQDGSARSALITTTVMEEDNARGLYCTDKGVIYFSDGGIRKLENGQVSTVTTAVNGFMAYDEDSNTFFVRGATAFTVNAFNPRTGKSEPVCGMPTPKDDKTGIGKRFNKNSDGPALTHVSFNSNFTGCVWDRYHKALWVGGPDETRFRWLKDGWVKTVIPKDQGKLVWCHVVGASPKGHLYVMGHSNPTGFFIARNRKETKP